MDARGMLKNCKAAGKDGVIGKNKIGMRLAYKVATTVHITCLKFI